MKVLVIIPAYNEEENIERVVNDMTSQNREYDYVIINDGSKDQTSAICHANHYNIVDLPVNLGLEGAFQTGLKYADLHDYDYAVQLDADGQHSPVYIKDMIQKAQEGYDIVIGSRFVTEKKPWNARMLGNRMIEAAIRISTGKKITDPTSGMRLYNRNMIHEFASNINYGPEPDTISFLLKQGVAVASVQVTMQERIAGKSYLNFARSASYMMRMMIAILLINNFRKR